MTSNKFALLIAFITLASPSASAQGFGRVANTPYNAGVTVINPPSVMPVNLMNQFRDAWRTHRLSMTSAAIAYLNGRDLGGVQMSQNQLRIADEGRLYVGSDARGFTFRFAVTKNTLSTFLRTPNKPANGIIPQFTVSFDLDIAIDVNISGNQLVATPARIRVTPSQPVGRNANAALALAAGNISRILASPEFAAALLSQLNAGAYSPPRELTTTLSQINPILQRAAAGGSITAGYDGGSGNITLTLRRPGA